MTKVKNNKIVVKFMNDGIVTKETKYNSLMAVAKDLNIDYFHVRRVYLQSTKKEIKKVQPYIKQLCEMMQILDNDEYFKMPTISV